MALLWATDCWLGQSAQAAENATRDERAGAGALVPLLLDLPAAPFIGTPPDLPNSSKLEPLSNKPRPPMMVPAGLKNLAPAAKLTCSDTNAPADALRKITDGKKESEDENVLFLRKGLQYVQMDFGSLQEIFALVIWHAFDSFKIYRCVIVQAADDAAFTQNVRTLFNNDQTNAAGLGLGTDREFFETREGKLVDAKGLKARCLRFYSKGSTAFTLNGSSASPLNEYTEIEVHGRPAAGP